MRSDTAADEGRTHGGTERSTAADIERHLREALDGAETDETRFHLRQALQLMRALE